MICSYLKQLNMKMKRFLPIGLLFTILLPGCQTNEMDDIPTAATNEKVVLTPQELLSVKFESSPELEQTELFDLVKAFQSTEVKKNVNTRGAASAVSCEIKDKYYLNKNTAAELNTKSAEAEQEQIPIYKIGFSAEKDTGLAIVSGDRRAPHILAYIDKVKSNDASLLDGPSALLQWAEMYVQNEVKAFDAIKDSLYESAVSKISDGLNLPIQDIKYETIADKVAVVNNDATRSQPIEEVPSNLNQNSAVGPFCFSAWGQWEPYNCKLPRGNCEKYFPGWIEESNYPTGAAPVAIAHLMTCVEPAMTITGVRMNWSYLTENKEIKAPDYFTAGDPLDKREMVGTLFKQIYEKTKSYEVKNTNGVVTGATCSVTDVNNYIQSIFACNAVEGWNINTVKSSLKAERAVYVYGKADNRESAGVTPFILDGLKEMYGRIENVPKNVNLTYLHANFGFGGGYQDGYYLMEIEKPTITFETTIPLIFKDNAMTIIAHIRKK